MKESTRTRITSGILITTGTALSFLAFKGLLDVLTIMINIFKATPSILWTGKQSMMIILLIISGSAITWLGIQIGIGSINVGIKKLKAQRAKEKINNILKDIQKKD